MKVYTYSEARKNLKTLLEESDRDGGVIIKHRSGAQYRFKPSKPQKSPLDVPGVQTNINMEDWMKIIREGREREYEDK